MSTETDHFTAVLEITEVTTTEKDGGYNQPKIVERGKRDVARIVLRAESLEKLQAKATAHIALIEN
jgi:hypothetical protein